MIKKNNKIKKKIIAIFLAAAMVSVTMTALIMHVGAIGPPPALPHTFWGTVTIDGELAPNGTVVSVRVGDICVENTTTTNGYYLLIVQENDANFGDLLYFYVDNIFIGEKPAFTSGGVTQLNLSVVQPSPTSINITPETVTLYVNEIQQFTATVLPDDADQNVTWIVDNVTGNGTINETGLFTALTAGIVNVTAISVVDTNITRTANVTVAEPPAPEVPGFGIVATILALLGTILAFFGAVYYCLKRIKNKQMGGTR